MVSSLRLGVKGALELLRLLFLWLKKVWRRFTSSSSILWLLITALVSGVFIISYGWNLKTEQTIGALVAALAVPLAFISQRSVLREDQRQKMRYEAYVSVLPRVETIENELAAISVSSIKSSNKIIVAQSLRTALKDLTNTYHSHEMVFIKANLSFKYLHFSLMKLAKMLDEVERSAEFNGYGDKIYPSGAESSYEKCKGCASDIASYFFDLKKGLIESLGFAKLNGAYIEERKPLDRKHKLLRNVATKDNLEKLEKEALN